ncbi:hypothetical protein Nepgr_000737 [Nepenthes gracilis]|uniref:Uncharacterized protein n=1 Tax=Nepenthes gracilis TaxID=150966 RepID=A0AAD3P5T3_NEPGR|nr:hypothetical protein Nepgr_000737 [Nepenthes gracilis]
MLMRCTRIPKTGEESSVRYWWPLDTGQSPSTSVSAESPSIILHFNCDSELLLLACSFEINFKTSINKPLTFLSNKMPPITNSRRFSFFGFGDLHTEAETSSTDGLKKSVEVAPLLKLKTEKDVYRPGEAVWVTIELENPHDLNNDDSDTGSLDRSLLVEGLSFELKGIEKLDTQWFTTQKPLPGSKQRRGEYVFLDCSTMSIVSNQIVLSGANKKYLVRTELPNVIPPSYRGATIRYSYYVRSALFGWWLKQENDHSNRDSVRDVVRLEARIPLQIWISQKGSGLLVEETQSNGIVPAQTIKMDMYWREIKGDSDWVRANETYDGVEEVYESSRDEISSVSSYNPAKESVFKFSVSSLSQQSSASRFLNREVLPVEADELLHNSSGDVFSSSKPSATVSFSKSLSKDDDDDHIGVPAGLRTLESAASEGFIRGRSYNIRLDDQVLLRFSPKKSDSNYYFSDAIGGTLTFFHEGARRCLEVSITLEISESINRSFVHPSRRNSPTITKVHSDYHEVVADLVQTSFLFSIPMDGPMSFSTSHVSVQWALRFEFSTTPKNVDWSRYDHPLLVQGRDRCEWLLPITVHAPQPGTQNWKSLSFGSLSFRD